MALVPFSVTGPAASQELQERLLQVGPFSLMLQQRPAASGNTAHLSAAQRQQRPVDGSASSDQQDVGEGVQQLQQQQQQPDLSNVGFVLWQSGYLLADFLLLRLHSLQAASAATWGHAAGSSSAGSWAGTRVLELGCGAGTVGMFLAKAGAQVVLTDQGHVLGLTRDNLAMNFPAAIRRPEIPTSKPCSTTTLKEDAAGTAAAAHAAKHIPSTRSPAFRVSAASQRTSAGAITGSATRSSRLSATEAFAAAFSTAALAGGCQELQQAELHRQQQEDETTAAAAGAGADASHMVSQVFAQGPLVVQYNWGEPLEQLHSRTAAEAAQRLDLRAALDADSSRQQEQSVSQGSGTNQPDHAAVSQAMSSRGIDIILGADLLYDPQGHAPLLSTLQQLAAASPHAVVYLAWRCRGLGEEAFEWAAAAAGWVVQAVPTQLLHPEFQDGSYTVVCMVWMP